MAKFVGYWNLAILDEEIWRGIFGLLILILLPFYLITIVIIQFEMVNTHIYLHRAFFLIKQRNIDRCLLDRQEKETTQKKKTFSLKDLSSAFALLGLGLSLSLLCFLVERCWNLFHKIQAKNRVHKIRKIILVKA